MRKRVVTTPAALREQGEDWLDLEHVATVEVTSEDHDFPIESSLSIEHRQGWRAAEPRCSNNSAAFCCISLVFEEDEVNRTQEFVLRSGEAEEYRVELSDVTTLELTIVPDIEGGAACASLKSLLLA
jgi:hypothetical protein